MKKIMIIFALLIPLLSSMTSLAYGQANTGTILGTITDPGGATVENVKISVKNTATGIIKEAVTDSEGNYRIPYLIPGSYEVTAEAPNFKRAIQPVIELQVDQKARIDFALQVGDVNETVQVATEVPLLQTQSIEQSQVITTKQMQELPLNIRDFGQLASLQTGTVVGAGGLGEGYGADNPQSTGGAIRTNGLGQDANNWQLDGISNNEAFFSIISVSPSLDAIQEFKVTTNNYSAEFGRAGGANVQVSIKSGTNEFHGGVFEFLRNDKLDANSFFNNRSGAGKKPYKQNQFGGFLGGPIIKNKTFFFGDYEGLRVRQSTTGLITIPTALQRQGIFTEPGQFTIYDPLTGQPFPDNTIPAARISPVASKILNFFPAPNIPGAGLANNFIGTSRFVQNRDTFDVRVDHTISQKDQFFARYSFLNAKLDSPSLFSDSPTDPLSGSGTTARSRNQNGVLSGVHTFSATTINEFRIGFNRVNTEWGAFDEGLNTADEVGIPGINDACPDCGGLPRINVQGISSFGHALFAPTIRHDTILQFVDNVTLNRGNHNIRIGADLNNVQADLFQTANPVGEFNFSRNLTSNKGQGGIGLASFLLGNYDSANRLLMEKAPEYRTKHLFFYGQDDYRANKNLTLNLGLRYEIYTAATDANKRLSNFDLTTGDILLGCVATSCTGGVDTEYGNLAPRLGLAYTPGGGKTVIRLGSGITYFPPGFGGLIGTLGENYPFVRAQVVTSPNVFTPGPSLSQGFGPIPIPQQRPGAPEGHIIPVGRANFVPSENKITRVYQWSASVQRELVKDLVADATYVGNSQNNIFLNLALNVPRPGGDPTGTLTLQQRRPYYALNPDLPEILYRTNAGKGSYHALQLKLDKRFSNGLSFLAGYTWSKTLIAGLNYVDPFNYMEKGRASYDVPHVLTLSYIYDLPVGRERRFGSGWSGVTEVFLGGWQVSGVSRYQSGFPFTPSIASNLDNGRGNRPNRICSGELSNPTIDRWFDSKCFVASPNNIIGNSGFNILRGPSWSRSDITLAKNFFLTEGTRIQFRADFLNAFNQVAFGNPNTSVDNPGGGTISGNINGYNPRLIQFGLKLYF